MCLGKAIKMLKIVCCLNVLAAVGGMSVPRQENSDPLLRHTFAILKNGVPICGGASVGRNGQFIATAAHCVYREPKSLLGIIQSGNGEKESVKRVFVHPYYMPPSADYDIALLKVEKNNSRNEDDEGLPLNKVPPTSVVELKAFSWNLNEMKTNIEIGTLEDRKYCRTKLANHILVSTRMLCAYTQSVMDGTPLIGDNKLFGIGSYYVSGINEKLPKIFTNIANPEIYSFIERYAD